MDRDIYDGKGCDAGRGDSSIVKAISRVSSGIVPVVAVEAILDKIFHVWPV